MTFAGSILRKYPQSLPRYTSYPPANHFVAGKGVELGPALQAAADHSGAVSVYIHIPYCDRLCWFCGCHTKQTLRYEPVRTYVNSLVDEIALFGANVTSKPKLSALHLGGGSPSLLQASELDSIRQVLAGVFVITGESEISVEIDPTDVRSGTIADLMSFGMTRASIGVQDFDPAVQAAINRRQNFESTRDVIDELRQAGIPSINIDALYGLPLQTEDRLNQTIVKVLSLLPDRIALFGYAHVPWLKPHQKLIDVADLPDDKARFAQSTTAGNAIMRAGYAPIGIDHFARPQDPLAVAQSKGRLHRNFQGYTTDDATVLIGFGPSSISRFPGGYVQNVVATGQYQARIARGILPGDRGLALNDDDIMRGWVIERLMCDFAFSLEELHRRFAVAAGAISAQAREFAAKDTDGLCEIKDNSFSVKPQARPFVRIVASWFDVWMSATPRQYSKAV